MGRGDRWRGLTVAKVAKNGGGDEWRGWTVATDKVARVAMVDGGEVWAGGEGGDHGQK